MSGDGRKLAASFLFVLPLCVLVGVLFSAPLFLHQAVTAPCSGPNPLREWWWAGLQLWSFPVAYRVLCAATPLVILALPETFFAQCHESSRRYGARLRAMFSNRFAAFAFAGLVMWVLRSSSLSFGDSQFYVTDLIPRQAFSIRKVFIDYDSVGASLISTYGYRYANLVIAATPLLWYQLTGIGSVLGFLAFVSAQRRTALLASITSLAILFTGNWSQATLGAPENYCQVYLCVVLYAMLAVECLAGRAPLWKPFLAFAIGAFFHLMIGWLVPTLLVLAVMRWRSEGTNGRLSAIIALVLPAALTLAICYFFGFDLSFMAGGNAAEGKLIPFISPMDAYSGGSNFHYTTFDPKHLFHILQENILMGWPGILAVVVALPFVSARDVLRDSRAQFLIALLGCGLLFSLLWNPDLEMWKDQDLFSLPGVAWCLLGAYIHVGPALGRVSPSVRRRLLAVIIIGGLVWRLPVAIYHSILSENYSYPATLVAPCPFDDQNRLALNGPF